MNDRLAARFFCVMFFGAAPVTVLDASCSPTSDRWIGAYQVPPYQALSGVLGSDIRGHYWVLGNGAAANSGSCVVDASVNSILQDDGLGNKYFAGNWNDACNLGCIAPTDTAVLVIEQRVNEGTVVHSSRYAVTRVALDATTGGFNTDRVSNGTAIGYGSYACPGGVSCVTALSAFPFPYISTDPATGANYNPDTGTGTVAVSFFPPNPAGYSAPGAAVGVAIAGYQVYQWNGAVAPTTSNASGWSPIYPALTPADCTAGTCFKLVTVNALPAFQYAWFTLGLKFEDGTGSAFVGANSTRFGPYVPGPGQPRPVPDGKFILGTPLKSSKGSGDNINVTFDTTKCSTAGYNAYWGVLGPSGITNYGYSGAQCALATGGAITSIPAASSAWFVVVGSDGTGVESGNVQDSSGVWHGYGYGLCGVYNQTPTSCP